MHILQVHCSPYISKEGVKENLFYNQELLKLVIISSILITFMLDSGVKLDTSPSQGLKG